RLENSTWHYTPHRCSSRTRPPFPLLSALSSLRVDTLGNIGHDVDMARPKGHRMSPKAWEDVLNLRGTTLTEVAKRADLQRATLSGLTGGHARASVPMARRVADALGVHVETLFPTMRAVFAEADEAA